MGDSDPQETHGYEAERRRLRQQWNANESELQRLRELPTGDVLTPRSESGTATPSKTPSNDWGAMLLRPAEAIIGAEVDMITWAAERPRRDSRVQGDHTPFGP